MNNMQLYEKSLAFSIILICIKYLYTFLFLKNGYANDRMPDIGVNKVGIPVFNQIIAYIFL